MSSISTGSNAPEIFVFKNKFVALNHSLPVFNLVAESWFPLITNKGYLSTRFSLFNFSFTLFTASSLGNNLSYKSPAIIIASTF